MSKSTFLFIGEIFWKTVFAGLLQFPFRIMQVPNQAVCSPKVN